MTVANIPGMRIIPHCDLTPKQARILTDRIKSKMGDLMSDIAKAWIGRAHAVLGYDTWGNYVNEEFGHAPLYLPREERKAVVALLRGQGMSTRAIAPTVGVSHETVAQDLTPVRNLTPESEVVPVTGLDGKPYPPTCTLPKATPPTRVDGEETITCPTCGGTGKVTQ